MQRNSKDLTIEFVLYLLTVVLMYAQLMTTVPWFGKSCKMAALCLIAFDERVTFWLQPVRLLPCACAYVALFARRLAYNHYAIAHAYNAANAHAQDSDQAC